MSGFRDFIFQLFGIIGGVGVVVVAGNMITEAVVLRTDRPIRVRLLFHVKFMQNQHL